MRSSCAARRIGHRVHPPLHARVRPAELDVDFATFGVMLWVFHSGPDQFRSGWFVESLGTRPLVIFAIRTRRVPFFRSHPSFPLVLAALGVVAVGAVLPSTPLAHALGFQRLPGGFFIALAGLALAYLLLIELGKRAFYGAVRAQEAPVKRRLDDGRRHLRHLRRRAAHLGHAPVALEVRAHRLR
jgi:P-type Mg2+ transporter